VASADDRKVGRFDLGGDLGDQGVVVSRWSVSFRRFRRRHGSRPTAQRLRAKSAAMSTNQKKLSSIVWTYAFETGTNGLNALSVSETIGTPRCAADAIVRPKAVARTASKAAAQRRSSKGRADIVERKVTHAEIGERARRHAG
jgi:hypothetical protein